MVKDENGIDDGITDWLPRFGVLIFAVGFCLVIGTFNFLTHSYPGWDVSKEKPEFQAIDTNSWIGFYIFSIIGTPLIVLTGKKYLAQRHYYQNLSKT